MGSASSSGPRASLDVPSCFPRLTGSSKSNTHRDWTLAPGLCSAWVPATQAILP